AVAVVITQAIGRIDRPRVVRRQARERADRAAAWPANDGLVNDACRACADVDEQLILSEESVAAGVVFAELPICADARIDARADRGGVMPLADDAITDPLARDAL